jgi:outer membrane receptor for ferrienterochelin and colicins
MTVNYFRMNRSLFQLAFLSLAVMHAHAENTLELGTISVSGQQDDVSARRDATTQKVIVDRNEIDSLGVQTIGEVLSRLPGVELKGNAVRARGMSRDSVQILMDGERLVGGMTGALDRLSAEQLERVEILRGSSAEFGGAASLTINLVNKKLLPKRSTTFKLGLGMRGDQPNSEFSWTENGGTENFAWSLPFTSNVRDAPINRNTLRQFSTSGVNAFWQEERTRGDANFSHHSFSPRFTWKFGRDNLTLTPMFFYGPSQNDSRSRVNPNVAGGGAGGFNDLGNRDLSDSGVHRMWRMRAEGVKFIQDAKLSGHFSVNRGKNALDTTREIRNVASGLTRFDESTRTETNEVNTALRVDQSFFESHLHSLGVEYVKTRREDAQLFGGGFNATDDYRASSTDRIVWIQDDWTPKDSLTLTTGVRLERMEIAAENNTQARTGVLPSVALRWQPSASWVLRTSLGAGLKMPRLDEISNATTRSLGPNTPVEADRRGNTSLRPERNLNFEAVLERYLPQEAGVIGANLYVRSTQDFIERRVQQEGVRWVDRPFNEGDALHYGVEFDAKVRMDSWGWNGATLKSHLTLPYGRVEDERLNTKRMARDVPRYVLNLGLEQSLPALKSTYGITAQISGRSETAIPNEQTGIGRSVTIVDGYWRYKLSPSYNVRFTVRNLLKADTRRQNAFVQGPNDWQLDTDDRVMRRWMVSLEGQW